ncbi:hypothetical protein K0U27_00705 [archaeon]|nr:hypothetical protein [archaeon]
MVDLGFFSDYLWTAILAPIGIGMQKIWSHESRLSKVEAVQQLKKEDIENLHKKLCDTDTKLEKVSGQISNLQGRFDEHKDN